MTGASIRFPHLGIVIEHLDKSISIFGFNIAYYGIIIGIGMLCGIAMAVHEGRGRTRKCIMISHYVRLFQLSWAAGFIMWPLNGPITVSIRWKS